MLIRNYENFSRKVKLGLSLGVLKQFIPGINYKVENSICNFLELSHIPGLDKS